MSITRRSVWLSTFPRSAVHPEYPYLFHFETDGMKINSCSQSVSTYRPLRVIHIATRFRGRFPADKKRKLFLENAKIRIKDVR